MFEQISALGGAVGHPDSFAEPIGPKAAEALDVGRAVHAADGHEEHSAVTIQLVAARARVFGDGLGDGRRILPGEGGFRIHPTMKKVLFSAWLACAGILLSGSSLHGQVPLPELRKGNETEAMSNARQIGLLLFEFENEYGSFPAEDTRKEVEDTAGAKLPADDKSSNSMFRQLFVAGFTKREDLFFASIPGAKKGDNDAAAGKLLAKGENAFAYIAGMSTAANPGRPLLVCPLIPGTTKFDPKPFGGKALILRIDCSAQLLPIGEDGRVLEKGADLLSKDHPVWGGKAPDIRYPDLLAVEE